MVNKCQENAFFCSEYKILELSNGRYIIKTFDYRYLIYYK